MNLVERAKQLQANTDSKFKILQRTLEQVHHASRQLAQTSARVSELNSQNVTRARVMLAQKGVDDEKLERQLTMLEIDLKSAPESTTLSKETDLETFVASHLTAAIAQTIEESRREAEEYSLRNYATKIEDEWLKAKRELIGELAQMKSAQDTPLGLQPGTPASHKKQFIPPSPFPIYPGEKTSMDEKMKQFAEVVITLNLEHKTLGKPFPIIGKLKAVQERTIDSVFNRKADLCDCWSILEYIFHEKAQRGLDISERQMIQGAISFLQNQYYDIMVTEVRHRSEIARVGGEGTKLSMIEGFARIMETHYASNDIRLDPDVVTWMKVYFCFRSGALAEAKEILHASSLSGDFAQLLDAYSSPQGIDRNTLQQVQSMYRKLERSRETSNTYQEILYNIVGQCDNNKPSRIPFWSTHDYMWFQLLMISRSGDAIADAPLGRKRITLDELQNFLTRYGSGYFNKSGKNPLLYLHILLLSLQFERAINYLISLDYFSVEAVHFAVALHYYDKLNQPTVRKAQPIFEEKPDQRPTLNYVRLLQQYIRMLSPTDVFASLNYYLTIPDDDTRRDCITSLVLETKRYVEFFGGFQQDTRQPGYLQQVGIREADIAVIARLAALECEERGLYEDASKLYILVELFEPLIQILIKQLSKVLPSSRTHSDRIALVEQADYVIRLCEGRGKQYSVLETLKMLRQLIEFFDRIHTGEFYPARDIIQKLRLVPFNPAETQQCLQRFDELDESIQRNFGAVLLGTMACLHNIYQSHIAHVQKTPNKGTSSLEQNLKLVREQAKAIITFAGKNQYRLPQDIYSKLLRMEVDMKTNVL